MKLGLYRKVMINLSKKHEITRTEFEILLFAVESDVINRGVVLENVPCSEDSLSDALRYLKNNNYLKVVRERAHKRARLYSTTRKAKLMITEFYKQLNINN